METAAPQIEMNDTEQSQPDSEPIVIEHVTVPTERPAKAKGALQVSLDKVNDNKFILLRCKRQRLLSTLSKILPRNIRRFLNGQQKN